MIQWVPECRNRSHRAYLLSGENNPILAQHGSELMNEVFLETGPDTDRESVFSSSQKHSKSFKSRKHYKIIFTHNTTGEILTCSLTQTNVAESVDHCAKYYCVCSWLWGNYVYATNTALWKQIYPNDRPLLLISVLLELYLIFDFTSVPVYVVALTTLQLRLSC